MCLYNVAHIQGILNPLLSIFIEEHELLLLPRQGAEEARPKAAGNGLVTGKNELPVLHDVLLEKHLGHVCFLQFVGCRRYKITLKLQLGFGELFQLNLLLRVLE